MPRARTRAGPSRSRPRRGRTRQLPLRGCPSITRPRVAAGSRLVGPDVLFIGPLPTRRGLGRPHHHLALEVADLFAALVDAFRLYRDDAPVALRREFLVEHAGLRVD